MDLNSLVGLVVSDIALQNDTLGIAFENGSGLSVFNRFEIDGGDTAMLGQIKGQRLVSIRDSAATIDFTFDCGMTIRVGMTDSDFVGPEAMLYQDADTIEVWREESIKRPTE